MTPKVTHARLPQGEAKKTKARTDAHVRAQQGQKDEDVKRVQDRTKSARGCDEKEPSAQGQTMKNHLIVKPGRPETWV